MSSKTRVKYGINFGVWLTVRSIKRIVTAIIHGYQNTTRQALLFTRMAYQLSTRMYKYLVHNLDKIIKYTSCRMRVGLMASSEWAL